MEIKELLWDDWNEAHIERKGISIQDVYEVCVNEQYTPLIEKSRRGTVAIWGRTSAGEYLLVILSPRGRGSFYPVTAREMQDRERRRYQKWLK